MSSSSSSSISGEIFVVPKIAQGHLFLCIEICKLLLSRNYSITLLVDSDITSSIPSSLLHSPLFHFQLTKDIHGWYLQRDPGVTTRPICAIIDHIINKTTHHVFFKFAIPTVVFITSGACWAAVQHAIWVVRPGDMTPGEVRTLPGLPENMVLKYSDLKQRRHWMKMGPLHIRVDKYYNATLVVNHLKVGAMVSEKYPADMVNKDDILGGMQRVLKDNEIKRQSEILGAKFEQGFPASSLASLDDFSDFIKHKAAA